MTLAEGMLFVDIHKPEKKDDGLQKNEYGIIIGSSQPSSAYEWQDATIVITSDEEKYPVGSTWMIGNDPGTPIIYHGERYTLISTSKIKSGKPVR